MQKKAKIAIIGGGTAGTAAAWALQKTADVYLFEAESKLGGHAYSAEFTENNEHIYVDMGVELFTEKLSPNLCAMFSYLQLESYAAPLSFCATFNNNEYWNNLGANTPLWRKHRAELDRFHQDMHAVLYNEQYKGISLGEFLNKNKYSEEFIQKFVLPMMTTFSGCNAPSLEYSLIYTAYSFSQGLLSFFHAPTWRKLKGGINNYLMILQEMLQVNVRLNTPIKIVRRTSENILIIDHLDNKYEFDNVIFATHANTTLKLLDNPSSIENRLLSQFDYVDVEAVLHSDSNFLNKDLSHNCYCEYRAGGLAAKDDTGSLTRITNNLDIYKQIKKPLLVTFDPKYAIDSRKIYAIKKWQLPKLRPQDLYRKTLFGTAQGKDRIWFCGTDFSFSGHEGAFVSGLVVANALGASYPFNNNMWAKIQFNVIKNLMGIHTLQSKLLNKFVNSSTKILRRQKNLYQCYLSKVITDLYI